jgi:peptidoglycan hydrolase CwlO-like protein
MKNLKKYRVALIVSCIFSSIAITATATQSTTATIQADSDYTISLLKDCQPVAQYPMTEQQIKAYLMLKEAEKKMNGLESPIKAIEQDIKQYSDEIEQLTKLAIQETDSTLHIDKSYLKQQNIVVKKLNNLMAIHQADFDALEEQGRIIGDVANKFSEAIEVGFEELDYDHIRVNDPNKAKRKWHCYSDSISL